MKLRDGHSSLHARVEVVDVAVAPSTDFQNTNGVPSADTPSVCVRLLEMTTTEGQAVQMPAVLLLQRSNGYVAEVLEHSGELVDAVTHGDVTSAADVNVKQRRSWRAMLRGLVEFMSVQVHGDDEPADQAPHRRLSASVGATWEDGHDGGMANTAAPNGGADSHLGRHHHDAAATYHVVHHTVTGSQNTTYHARYMQQSHARCLTSDVACARSRDGVAWLYQRSLRTSDTRATIEDSHTHSRVSRHVETGHTVVFDRDGSDGRIVSITGRGRAVLQGPYDADAFHRDADHARPWGNDRPTLHDGEVVEATKLEWIGHSNNSDSERAARHSHTGSRLGGDVVFAADPLAAAADVAQRLGTYAPQLRALNGDSDRAIALLASVFESAGGWTSWRLLDRTTSRLDARHNPVGTWNDEVTLRQFQQLGVPLFPSESESSRSNLLPMAVSPWGGVVPTSARTSVPMAVSAAFQVLQPLLACYHAPGADTLQCAAAVARAFRVNSTLLAPTVEWLLLRPADALPIPVSFDDAMRVVGLGANHNPAAVATYFVNAQARGTARTPDALAVLKVMGDRGGGGDGPALIFPFFSTTVASIIPPLRDGVGRVGVIMIHRHLLAQPLSPDVMSLCG